MGSELEIELGVSGKGKTKREAMQDAEKNAHTFWEMRYPDCDLVMYGTRNIFIGDEPNIECIRDVKYVKR